VEKSEDRRFDEEKPSWLIAAQKIYPMSDDKYYKMLIAARRSAKINLNRLNAFTSPNYQRKCIKFGGENIVIDAAIALRHCRSVCKSVLQR